MTTSLATFQWVRILLTSVAIIMVSFASVTAIIFVYAFALAFQARGAPDVNQITRFANQVAPIGSIALTTLMTIGGAAWVARRARARPQAHGMLVGVCVALIVLVLGRSIDLPHLAVFVLTLGAGWLGARSQ